MHSASLPKPSRRKVAAIVAEATVVQALVSLSSLIFPALAPKLAECLGVTPSMVGYQVSIVYGGAMLTSLLGGSIVRRLGACRTSQTALVCSGLGCLLASLAWLPGLAAAAFLIGLGYGLTNPAGAHLLSRFTSPANRNLVYSIKQTGVPLGGMMAGLMAPPITLTWGWQWAVAAVALPCLALALLLQGQRAALDKDRDPHSPLGADPLAGLAAVWRRPRLRWLSLTGFLFAMVQLCLTTFLVTMLVGDVHLPLIQAGVVLSTVQVSGVIGRLVWGAWADRMKDGCKMLIILGALSLAGACATGMMTPGWPLPAIHAALLLFGVSAIGWNGVFLAEVARSAAPDQISRATGGALFFTYGGVLVGPSSFAVIFTPVGSYTATYGLTGVAAALGLLFLVLARRA